jgi:peptidoglycan-associated lipoprotein
MSGFYRMACLIGVVGLLLAGTAGCSKSIDAGSGSKEFEQGQGAKSGETGKEQQARGESGSEPLKGFQPAGKTSEERVGGGGTLTAKSDSSDAAERAREQQAAGAGSGLLDVFFGYDSWKLSDEGKNVLARDAEWLKSNPKQKLTVEGHCDERGTQAYNLVLGEKRAKAARSYLIELGVKGDRLAVRSYGKEKPFCTQQDESCYQQNRRAHVITRP